MHSSSAEQHKLSESYRSRGNKNNFAALSAFTKASSDNLRLNILRVVRHNAYHVLELCEILGMSQPALSHHLKILCNAHLLQTRREGVYIFYDRALNGGNLETEALRQALWTALDTYPLPKSISMSIEVVNKKRAHSSMRFFEKNIHKFRAQQDLMARYDHYAPVVETLLKEQGPSKRTSAAIDVGTGDGAFLPVMANYCNQLTALDVSPKMLENARNTAQTSKIPNINFILGDVNSIELAPKLFDCAVMNMVLHHIPSPAQAIKNISKALKPSGRLILTELCAHDQDWAREYCGDLWLGFTPEQLDAMAEQSGIYPNRSQYIGQKNGFQIQVREFLVA